jgi:CubicO group peptidase (beta-lactamase class C family)
MSSPWYRTHHERSAVLYLLGLLAFASGCARLASPQIAVPADDPSCGVVPEGVESLQAVLEPMRKAQHLPALAAAVVSPDKLLALGVVGVRASPYPTHACTNDAFHLGSDSKAMTAVVIAKLVELQQLSWQLRIRDVFGDIAGLKPAYADVTLEQLLAHRAGFPHDPGLLPIFEMHKLTGPLSEQRKLYVARALQEPPINQPGTSYSYSNIGYVVAAAMAEHVTQRSWEDLVRQYVFEPLHMKNAGFGITAHDHQLDGLWPHDMSHGAPEPVVSGPNADNPLVMAPAGGIHVAIEGWARFVSDALAGLEGHGQLLEAKSYQELFTPPFEGEYAHGWTRLYRSDFGGYVFKHGGSNTINYALVWLLPKKRLAVVVATNAGGGHTFEACDAVVAKLIKTYARE